MGRWAARVRIGDGYRGSGRRGRLTAVSPHCQTPRAAAEYLARWYAGIYGPGWGTMIERRRLRVPWCTRQCKGGGWHLWVWELGYKRQVCHTTSRGRATFRPVEFETKQEAVRFVVDWVVRRWGLFAFDRQTWRVLWRVDE